MESKIEAIVCMIIQGIMDCVESVFDTFVIASGRKTIKVFFVCVAFLILSLILLVAKQIAFINWYEALVACVATGVIAVICNVNDTVVKDIKKKLMGRRK